MFHLARAAFAVHFFFLLDFKTPRSCEQAHTRHRCYLCRITLMDLPNIDPTNWGGNEHLLHSCSKRFVWKETYSIRGKKWHLPNKRIRYLFASVLYQFDRNPTQNGKGCSMEFLQLYTLEVQLFHVWYACVISTVPSTHVIYPVFRKGAFREI